MTVNPSELTMIELKLPHQLHDLYLFHKYLRDEPAVGNIEHEVDAKYQPRFGVV